MAFTRKLFHSYGARHALHLGFVAFLALAQSGLTGGTQAGHSDRYLGHAKAPLFAEAPPGKRDEDGFPARVAAVLRGDLLQLEDGRKLRLAGVQAPLPEGQGASSAGAWPGAEDSRAALEAMALGKDLWAVPTNRNYDRYGRSTALIYDEQGQSLQERLLEAGWLRLTGDGSLAERFSYFVKFEANARLARRGLWAYRAYRLRAAEEAEEIVGRFGIVEGQVLSVASVRKRLYLNFGSDWRNDFTVMIDASGQKAFAAVGLDPQSYEGRHLRIRGWIKSYNGAMIEVEDPRQIEVLEP